MKQASRYFPLFFCAVLFFGYSQSMESPWKKGANNVYTYSCELSKVSLTQDRWKRAIAGLNNLEASNHRTLDIKQDTNYVQIDVYESERELSGPDSKKWLRRLIIHIADKDTEHSTDKLNLVGCINTLKDLICSSDDAETAPPAQRFKGAWNRDILPSIKSKLARHIGQECAKMFIIKMGLSDFEPINHEALQKIKQLADELKTQEPNALLLLRIKKYTLASRTIQTQDEAFNTDYETLLQINTAGAA